MRIHSVAAAVPRTIVRNEEMIPVFGSEVVEKIIAGTGVREHRRAEPDLCASDLCCRAAEEILNNDAVDPGSIDALLFITQSPDYAFLPQTAPTLAGRLGLSERVFAADLKPGCTGFTDGLILAHSLIESGNFRRVLLMAGDTPSKHNSPTDQGTALLFGDAGSAALLEKESNRESVPFHFLNGSDGSGAEIIKVPYGDRNLSEESRNVELDGAKVFAFTIDRIPPMTSGLLELAGWSVSDVKSFVFHQANAYILNYLARKCRIPKDKLPMTLELFGNTSSASIPLTLLHHFQDKMIRGDRLVLIGFGVGLLWSGVATEWDGGNLYPIIEM